MLLNRRSSILDERLRIISPNVDNLKNSIVDKSQFTLITDILLKLAESNSKGITFIQGSQDEVFLSYHDLYIAALGGLKFLEKKGIKPGDKLLFQTDDNKSFVIAFWACILGGIVPVPLTVGRNSDHIRKVFNVWSILENPFLITTENHLNRISAFAETSDLDIACEQMKSNFIDFEALLTFKGKGSIIRVEEDDLAFIQFSSGSTGRPKGVMLTHKNLLTNLWAISEASVYEREDSMMSWMPLTHDMGLIGFHLNPMLVGMNHTLMPASLFVKLPALWFDKVTENHSTILCSPNFGYSYVLKHCQDREQSWDLSSVRLVYNGAEPISAQLCQEFLSYMEQYGLRREALCPVYGLAEASLAVSTSSLEDEVISLSLDRDYLNTGAQIRVKDSGLNTASFVNVGTAVNYCSLRIASQNNDLENEGVIGFIQIKGDNVTQGYYSNSRETVRVLSEDGWLNTGDLGFIYQDMLFVTGRYKDIIFSNGQNYYPHDLENIAEEVEGVELNKVVVCGYRDESKEKEEIISFVFYRGKIEDFIPLMNRLKSTINTKVELAIDRVIPVKLIPRTTSGKLQRFRLLELYRSGEFDEVIDTIERLEAENDANFIQPETELEKELANIWHDILKSNNVDVTVDFYALGGTSLKLAEMAMMVKQKMNVDLSTSILSTNRNIRDLAQAISILDKSEYQPIPIAVEQENYLLSSAQNRIYHACQINKSSTAYNLPVVLELKGKLDVTQLNQCLKLLVGRHDSLRMTFAYSGKPYIKIKNSAQVIVDLFEINETEIAQWLKRQVRPFDLNKGPLFRFAIAQFKEDQSILFMDFHHIIADGVSVANFLNELQLAYSGISILTPEMSYKDYINWEPSFLQTPAVRVQESYWYDILGSDIPVLNLPTDFNRPDVLTGKGAKVAFNLGEYTYKKLRRLSERLDVTMHVALLTFYRILLSKYSSQKDIIIGIPVANRTHPQLVSAFGMYVNNLPLRLKIHNNNSILSIIKAEQVNFLEAMDNQDIPFDEMVKSFGTQASSGRNGMFDTMFNYQNMDLPGQLKELTCKRHSFDPGYSKYDLSLEVFEEKNDLSLAFEYSTDLFKQDTIEEMIKHFTHLIKNIVATPDMRFEDLRLLDHIEFESVVYGYNRTATLEANNKTVYRLFEEQVKINPDAVALNFNGKSVSYGQLYNETLKVSNYLVFNTFNRDIIGISIPKSPELIAAILGVLASGRTFLLFDESLPKHRIHTILDDSRCRTILTNNIIETSYIKEFNDNVELVNIEELVNSPQNATAITSQVDLGNLAYVLYTSGTTGNPKGVAISQKALSNYISWATTEYVKGEKLSFALYSSLSFDLTITSIFTPLISGNELTIYQEAENEILIERVIRENKDDVIKLTPSHLELLVNNDLLNENSTVRRFIVGGEQLSSRLARDVYKRLNGNVEIFNEYGPTEATVGCMIYKFAPDNQQISVPIGRPVANTQIYLLDDTLNPVPVHVEGEIYVSGDGLARGYLNNVEATVDKFIDNPFIKGKKMYKTGDIAKRLPSGDLIYVGRRDNQVKVNGHRIELAEVEQAIVEHEAISEALVVFAEDLEQATGVLNAYYVANKGQNTDESSLKSFMAGRLPSYMIPARLTQLEQIPLTLNGKVDFDALPSSEMNGGNDYQLDAHIEQVFLSIWQSVLEQESVSIDDSFFALGGDSIKAVQIVSRLSENGIEVDVKDILVYQTIKHISERATEAAPRKKYEQGPINGEVEATPIVSWFLEQDFLVNSFYNQSVLLELKSRTNTTMIAKAFKALVQHYDTLRLNLDGNSLKFNELILFREVIVEIIEIGDSDELPVVCQEMRAEVNVRLGYPFKVAIIQQEGHADRLFITMHHLVIDGISWRILLESFYQVYNQLLDNLAVELPPKTASLKDWSETINAHAETTKAQNEREYWSKVDQQSFMVRTDYETEDWSVRNLAKESITLSIRQSQYLLSQAIRKLNVDIQAIFNTALLLTLKEFNGTNHAKVELENHGRHLAGVDTSRSIGWFTSMFPFQVSLLEEGDMLDQIKHVHECLQSIPNHGIGYGIHKFLLKTLNNSGNAMSEVRFNYLGQFGAELNNELFNYSLEDHGGESHPDNHITAKLEFNLMVINQELLITLNYNKEAYHESTIQSILNVFQLYLIEIIEVAQEQHSSISTEFEFANLEDDDLKALFD